MAVGTRVYVDLHRVLLLFYYYLSFKRKWLNLIDGGGFGKGLLLPGSLEKKEYLITAKFRAETP